MDLRLKFAILIIFNPLNAADRIEVLTKSEDIRNTWQTDYLKMCTEPHKFRPSVLLTCEKVFILKLFQFINLEVLSRTPALLRIHRFGGERMTKRIYETFANSSEVENQRVEGHQYSPGHRGRVADGLWRQHHDSSVKPLFERIQTIFRINPAIAEDFLILNYDVLGHYAPHYDHLFPMPRSYDEGWFEFFGNRVATALFIVQTADQGGGTVFPLLNITIQPEKGDLLLWMNADSNDNKEELSLHAACPIEKGKKMAVSLWFRGNFQDRLTCSTEDARYDARMLIERENRQYELRFNSRPQIYFEDYDEDELWPIEEEEEELLTF